MPRSVAVCRPTSQSPGGRVEVNPVFAPGFAALGVDSPAAFLDLPGEVVSGHPDRHVVRVLLPGFHAAFYLKRQHTVTRRERWRNWRAGFGRVSRCVREAALLKQLAAAGLPCPRWVAAGQDGRGRAFLLVEELVGSSDLRRLLSDNTLSPPDRARLAEDIGRSVALFHAAGITTPDLTAKHVLVAPDGAVALIDWQAARRVRAVPVADRVRCLATLHASVADGLATLRDRLRVLRAALRPARAAGIVRGRFSDFARRVAAETARLLDRRSIRDQRQPSTLNQRLVWLAGEAVCAIPDVAAVWPIPAVAGPFYGCEPGTLSVRLSDGRAATLIRGWSLAPLGRLRGWLRGRPWRSPGVTLGRVLFHLERYGVPAPRLFAFGQRYTGPASAEWFALHTPSADPFPGAPDAPLAEQLGGRLRQLHDAGCRPAGDPLVVFGSGAVIRDVTAIRLVRRLTDRERGADLRRLTGSLPPAVRAAAELGYRAGPGPVARHAPAGVRAHRLSSAGVSP